MDLVKLNTLNFMFRANSLILPHDLQFLFLPKNHNKFHRIKLRTDRKSFCLSNNFYLTSLIPILYS